MRIGHYILLFTTLRIITGCTPPQNQGNQTSDTDTIVSGKVKPTPPPLCDGFDFPVGNADGKGAYTDLASGKTYDSWYVAVETGDDFELGIHTGEDWNGTGGGNTDMGQPVYAIGTGIVRSAQAYPAPLGKVVMLEHQYLEADTICTLFSVYAHLDSLIVHKGDSINRRAQVGTIGNGGGDLLSAHLHLEIRKASLKDTPVLFWPSLMGKDKEWVMANYERPSTFIQSNRTLPSKPR